MMTIHDFCTVDCGRDSVNCRADDSSDIASIPIYLHLLPQLQSARPNVLDAVFLQEHPILREKFFRTTQIDFERTYTSVIPV